ncbi:AraC family transcriptional regulator ligand-binding domain-containing protein [Nocardia sp. NPDC088792]|uniref:AraC family transcriptional regulator ligand-binding domain-containing protein n=1 Tax=Nocardia sp. NPDC088792 TaxID=3364332 RepID=UPI0037F10C09
MTQLDPAYSAVLARCVIHTAGEGVDVRQLLRDAAAPEALLSSAHGMVTTPTYLRLWERAEFAQEAPEVGLRIAETYRIGRFGIFDYLFTTAATVADGLAAVRNSGSPMATNHRYRPGTDAREDERTTVLEMAEAEGRGADLTVQAAYASTLARIRHATGQPVTPTRITLRQPPPRRSGAFYDAFGTDRVEFRAPADSFTLRVADLALPLRTADPVLADIVRAHADSLPTPFLDRPRWVEQVHTALLEALTTGEASLATVARRLTVSPRTLQRRLAESGTTWRQELDLARRTLADRTPTATKSALAHRLGYSDARALRRAARRWNSTDTDSLAS